MSEWAGDISADELDRMYPAGFVDAHNGSDGLPCRDAVGPLDPDFHSDRCGCGQLITVDGGLAPIETLPDRLYRLVPPAREMLEPARPCPADPQLAAVEVLVDCWGHRAVLLTWGERYPASRGLVLGPSYPAAARLAGLVGAGSTGEADAVESWLLEVWREFAAPSSLRRAPR